MSGGLGRVRIGRDLLPALATGLARLVLRGELLAAVRRMRHSAAMVRLNLFLAVPELRGTRRLTAMAWRTIGYRAWNDLDFEFMPWRAHAVDGVERLRECLADARGAVVCCQHAGAYRRIYHELVGCGFDVTLVADDRVASTLKRTTRAQLVRQGTAAAAIEAFEQGFSVLDATTPGMVRQLFAALDRNSVVMLFLDGNTGAPLSGERPAVNTTPVSFFGQPIAVRHGICQIAHARRVPIVPVVSRWQAGLRPRTVCLPAIVPNPDLPEQEFCRQTLQRLFAIAEADIRERLAQFEHWMYFHRWRIAPPAAAAASVEAVAAAYAEIRAAGGTVSYSVDRRQVLVLCLGRRRVLADARCGRIVEAGTTLAAVVKVLGTPLPLRQIRARLGRRTTAAELLQMLAQLKAAGMLTARPPRQRRPWRPRPDQTRRDPPRRSLQ